MRASSITLLENQVSIMLLRSWEKRTKEPNSFAINYSFDKFRYYFTSLVMQLCSCPAQIITKRRLDFSLTADENGLVEFDYFKKSENKSIFPPSEVWRTLTWEMKWSASQENVESRWQIPQDTFKWLLVLLVLLLNKKEESIHFWSFRTRASYSQISRLYF